MTLRSTFAAALLVLATEACAVTVTDAGGAGAGGRREGAAGGASSVGDSTAVGVGAQGTGASSATQMSASSSANSTGAGGKMDCGSLPSQFAMPGCGVCVRHHCCAKAKHCDVGTDCYNLLVCEVQGQMTQGQCEAMFPNGVSSLAALNACIANSCATAGACGVSCPGSTFTANGGADATCNSCIAANCCAAFSALSTDITNSSDPNCMSGSQDCPPIADFTSCQGDPTGAACTADPDAAAAAKCDHDNCPNDCPQLICDSGISQEGNGAGACSDCLSSHCCAEFEGSMCSNSTDQSVCMTWLEDFNQCSVDGGVCNHDANAQAAYACYSATCASSCQ